MLESGTICIYNFDRETAILERIQYPNQLKDSENGTVSQKITAMTFANRTPPQFDVEALKKWDIPIEEEDQIEKYLLCGFNKGSIIFMKTEDTETIYSRFSFHREAVIFISELLH